LALKLEECTKMAPFIFATDWHLLQIQRLLNILFTRKLTTPNPNKRAKSPNQKINLINGKIAESKNSKT